MSLLKGENIDKLCRAVVETAEELEPSLTTTGLNLVRTAENISRKFTRAFTLFGSCYHLYSTCKRFKEADITLLG